MIQLDSVVRSRLPLIYTEKNDKHCMILYAEYIIKIRLDCLKFNPSTPKIYKHVTSPHNFLT